LTFEYNYYYHEGHEVGNMELDTLSNRVIGCAIEVHRVIGPWLTFVFFVVEIVSRKCLKGAEQLHLNNDSMATGAMPA